MKIEKRGKYAGVKVHLEPDEVQPFLDVYQDYVQAGMGTPTGVIDYFSLSVKLGKKIKQLIADEPNLLKPRTPEEIEAELKNEFESAKLKLAAMKQGKDWKEIHVK